MVKRKLSREEYENAEQMRTGPNYQGFAGQNQNFNVWFGEGEDILLHLGQLRN